MLRGVWTVFLFVLVVALIYLARGTIVIFVLAIFLAHLIAPLVERIDRKHTPARFAHDGPSYRSTARSIGVALAALIPVGAKIAEQASALAGRLPDALEGRPTERLSLPGRLKCGGRACPNSSRNRPLGSGTRLAASAERSSAPAYSPGSETWSR